MGEGGNRALLKCKWTSSFSNLCIDWNFTGQPHFAAYLPSRQSAGSCVFCVCLTSVIFIYTRQKTSTCTFTIVSFYGKDLRLFWHRHRLRFGLKCAHQTCTQTPPPKRRSWYGQMYRSSWSEHVASQVHQHFIFPTAAMLHFQSVSLCLHCANSFLCAG